MSYDLSAIFSQNGLLATKIPDYSPRKAQLLMALKVSDILQQQGILLCEAGTGTGKTFAYLVPAILSGKAIIISTGTKNLQDQLFYKDLPVIAAVVEPLIQRRLNVCLLKGRSNYICLYRFEKAFEEAWYDEQTMTDLIRIKQHLRLTEFADIAEFNMLKEQSSVWPIVTSTSDSCLGGACPNHDDCYIVKAREQAMSADITIVNHHLLMADLKLKSDSLGELLPAVQGYIIDEAHQLPDIASRFFSRDITSGQINDLLRDVRRFTAKAALSKKHILALNQDIRKMLDDLAMVLKRYRSRGNWSDVREAIRPLCDELLLVLKKLTTLLESVAPRGIELDNCYKRSEQIYHNFFELSDKTPEGMIHWFECRNKGFEIHLTPLSVGEAFKQKLDATSCSWIFTSATLTANNTESIDNPMISEPDKQSDHSSSSSLFAHFAGQLALKNTDSLRLESPFDYQQQAVSFALQAMPLPDDVNYIAVLIRRISPILHWLAGKTFILFTSYRALQEARDILSVMDFNLFVQGDAPKQQLINEFKTASRGVLLGTSSFWEGVDVKGDALSCVVIDKLPFASPSDPVLQARISYMQQQGQNAFYQYQLPQAAMTLKQGVGRLIRDVNDQGILIIADPRLYQKNYGYYLRQCLPEMPIETDFEQLQKHYQRMKRAD